MKRTTLFLLLMGIFVIGLQSISCAEDGDSENKKESEGAGIKEKGNNDSESDIDTEDESADTETGEESGDGDCGQEDGSCCTSGDECAEGLSSSISFMDGSCSCLKPCTFLECTAGSEQGYCSMVFGPNLNLCVNDADFGGDASDCTLGETCLTPSGAEDGICISMFSDDLTTEINRCASSCDNTPAECEEPLYCSPEISFVDNKLSLDYENGHCIPNPL
jgi:hypothetical protein